jgi:hypothetical protein
MNSWAPTVTELDWRCKGFCVNGFSFLVLGLLSVLQRPVALARLTGRCEDFCVTGFSFCCVEPCSSVKRSAAAAVKMRQSPVFGDFQGAVENLVLAFHCSVIFIALFVILPCKSGPGYHARSPAGMRSGHKILKRFSAAFQFCTGIVHFFAALRSARYNNFRTALSFGKKREHPALSANRRPS